MGVIRRMWWFGCFFLCLAGLAALSPHAVRAEVQQGLDADRTGTGIQVAQTAATGADALRAAVERGDIVTVADLLDAGADPDLRFSDGDPLLLRAIKRNHGDVTLALISAGADVSAADSIGWTPLMIAVFGGQDDLAAILLEEGADPDRESDDGTTARDLAAFREQGDLLAMMDDPGALAAGPAVQPLPAPAEPSPPQAEPQPEPQGQAEPEPQPDPEPEAPAEVLTELTLDPDTMPIPAAGPAPSEMPLELTRDLILEVQRRLLDLGYDPGPLDGLLGSRTRAAVLAFRADRGGPTDDTIGAALLAELSDAEAAAARPSPAEVAWNEIELSEDPATIAAYLRAYPDGPVSDLARQRLFELNAGLWSEPDRQDPAGSSASSTLSDLERYLVEQRAFFQAELNAYNKRHRIKASSNRSTFKVRNLYEASVIAEQDGLYRVNVLFGVGNWSSQAKDADLNVSRLIVLVRPAGRGYRIVGHSEDLTELSQRP